MENAKNFDVIEADFSYKKRSLEDILRDSKKINPKAVSEEVLNWLIGGVENFIDNSVKIFKLNIVIDNDNTDMPETKKMQDLYRAIPDDGEFDPEKIKKAQECRMELDKVTKKCYEDMRKHDKLLKNLFKRMIFFYEKIIPSPDKINKAFEIDGELKKLIGEKEIALNESDKAKIQAQITDKIKEGEKLIEYQTLNGEVDVIKFEYEAFDVGVKIFAPEASNGSENAQERQIVKQYTIPEGFTCWIEISYYNKQLPTSVF